MSSSHLAIFYFKEEIMMNEIKFAWEKTRIEYQKRYYAHLKSLEEKENNGSNKASVEYSRGHLL